MIILDRNTKNLEVKLGEAIATINLPWVISYQDIMSPPQGPGSEDGATNGTTAVVINGEWLLDFTQRIIHEVSIQNDDTIPHTVIIQLNNGATTRQIKSIYLLVGDSLHYEHGRGWYVLDKYGAPKETPSIEEMIYITATTPDSYVANSALVTQYFEGLTITCKFIGNNTGACTLNINGLGAKAIKIFKGSDLTADEIESGGIYDLTYDGTNWQLKTVTDKIVNAV